MNSITTLKISWPWSCEIMYQAFLILLHDEKPRINNNLGHQVLTVWLAWFPDPALLGYVPNMTVLGMILCILGVCIPNIFQELYILTVTILEESTQPTAFGRILICTSTDYNSSWHDIVGVCTKHDSSWYDS